MLEFDHILLSCIGTAARTGCEIGEVLRQQQGLVQFPAVRIYTALPILERRGWVIRASRCGRAQRWSLAADGHGRLDRWLRCPGGGPSSGRVFELLAVLASLPTARDDTGFLLRREVARLEAAPPPGFPLENAQTRRQQRRHELALKVLREGLRSVQESKYR